MKRRERPCIISAVPQTSVAELYCRNIPMRMDRNIPVFQAWTGLEWCCALRVAPFKPVLTCRITDALYMACMAGAARVRRPSDLAARSNAVLLKRPEVIRSAEVHGAVGIAQRISSLTFSCSEILMKACDPSVAATMRTSQCQNYLHGNRAYIPKAKLCKTP